MMMTFGLFYLLFKRRMAVYKSTFKYIIQSIIIMQVG